MLPAGSTSQAGHHYALRAMHPAATLDVTHDPSLRSWVESANDPATDFPIQNLPFCTIATKAGANAAAVVIGNQLVDLDGLQRAGLLGLQIGGSLTVDQIARLSYAARTQLRLKLSELLRAGVGKNPAQAEVERAMCPLEGTPLGLPCSIHNYTDFYASIHHASTVGAMFRPDNPLLPNYKHIPIGYHGRASTLVPHGTSIIRPKGQQGPPDASPSDAPTFGACKMLDHELEVGCIIAEGNEIGQPIAISAAHEAMLGLCLVNDWSARDVQRWEYQPLGPFLAKNFATTVSPFIVTTQALTPFRCAAYARPPSDPGPLPYLSSEDDARLGGFDIVLEVYLQSAQMLREKIAPVRISHGRGFKDMYWTFAQMIAHHTSNGCRLEPGDLLASGTVSGQAADARGCFLELTWDGTGKPRKPITLPTGEARTFLADGDTLTLKGFCEKEGFRRIGLGTCSGTVLPSVR